MLAGRAGELLRVVEHAVAVAILRRVFHLRVDDRFEHLDRVDLVFADPPRKQLLLAGFGIEAPAVAALHQRKSERIIVPDNQRHLVSAAGQRVLRFISCDETIARCAIGDGVARRYPIAGAAQRCEYRASIVRLDGLCERIRSFLGRCIGLFVCGLRAAVGRDQKYGERDQQQPGPFARAQSAIETVDIHHRLH